MAIEYKKWDGRGLGDGYMVCAGDNFFFPHVLCSGCGKDCSVDFNKYKGYGEGRYIYNSSLYRGAGKASGASSETWWDMGKGVVSGKGLGCGSGCIDFYDERCFGYDAKYGFCHGRGFYNSSTCWSEVTEYITTCLDK